MCFCIPDIRGVGHWCTPARCTWCNLNCGLQRGGACSLEEEDAAAAKQGHQITAAQYQGNKDQIRTQSGTGNCSPFWKNTPRRSHYSSTWCRNTPGNCKYKTPEVCRRSDQELRWRMAILSIYPPQKWRLHRTDSKMHAVWTPSGSKTTRSCSSKTTRACTPQNQAFSPWFRTLIHSLAANGPLCSDSCLRAPPPFTATYRRDDAAGVNSNDVSKQKFFEK